MMINCADMLRRMCDRVETSDSCCSPFWRKRKTFVEAKAREKMANNIRFNRLKLQRLTKYFVFMHFALLAFLQSFDFILIWVFRLQILCFYLDYYGRSFKCLNELSCCDEAGFCDFRTIPVEYWWCNDKSPVLCVCLRFHAPQNYP